MKSVKDFSDSVRYRDFSADIVWFFRHNIWVCRDVGLYLSADISSPDYQWEICIAVKEIKEAVGVLSAAFQLYGGLEVRWYGDVKWNPLRGEGACQINWQQEWNQAEIKKSNYKSLVKTGISAEDAVEWIEADDFELLNSIAFIIAKKDDTNISGIWEI